MIVKPISEYTKKRKYVSCRGKDAKRVREAYVGSCIYAVSANEECLIKVGKSTQLTSRLKSYKVSNPYETRLEGAFFIKERELLGRLEKLIHAELESEGKRVQGEWFRVDRKLLRTLVWECCYKIGANHEKSFGVMRLDCDVIPDPEVDAGVLTPRAIRYNSVKWHLNV